jgi:multiple sugar transport system ATP-binding protein
MASIRLKDVEKTYSTGRIALRGIHLDVAEGELMALVGPSGCGKTTTLRIVAGLESPTRGRVFLNERDVTQVPPQKRNVAIVFQNYVLFPHKTVRENLAFALRMQRVPAHVTVERVNKVSSTLGLGELLERKPGQLSGGERQRVALGRAIAREPAAFLLDEPLSNLDAQLRIQTRAELALLHRRLNATMIYVTHDQEEAMTLGDRVAVLRDGVLQQVAPPMEIYHRPANTFVAGFIGSPSMNFFRCTAGSDGGRVRISSPWFTLTAQSEKAAKAKPEGQEILLGVRPQDICVVPAAEANAVARVEVVQPLGRELSARLNLISNAGQVRATLMVPADTMLKEDDQVGIAFLRDRLHLFEAESGCRLD